MSKLDFENEILGKDLAKCIAEAHPHNFIVRATVIDGEDVTRITGDHIENRLNVALESGLVSRILFWG